MRAICEKCNPIKPRSISIGLVLVLCAVLGGCANTYPKVKADGVIVGLRHPRFEIPEPLLFDVRVRIFEPGEIPTSEDAARGLSDKIRTAESTYVAVQLRATLQESGYWGAVRVVPAAHTGDEVLVHGEILKSNGEQLALKVWAVDAMGRKWFAESFRCAVTEEECTKAVEDQNDVFQSIFNQIANKLATYCQTLTVDEIQEIRLVAEMRFVEDLVPTAFGGYLREEKGGMFSGDLIRLDRLPSEDDEFMSRAQSVRGRDHMLVDTLDAHYVGLHRDMKPAYADWRQIRIAEMNAIRAVDARKNAQVAKGLGAAFAGAALGAAAANSGGYDPGVGSAVGAVVGAGLALALRADEIGAEAEINKVALEEHGLSFGAEMEPLTLEVEGKTIELRGSAEAQYKQWHEILADLYRVETEPEVLPES